jgi:hypothetical protein
MTTTYTMKPMKLDTRALMHPEFPTISTADFQAWLASPLTKALKRSQMEQNADDEALLRQALECLERSDTLGWQANLPVIQAIKGRLGEKT